MKNNIFSIFIIVIIFFEGCDNPSNNPAAPAQPDYFPLKTGNYWIFNSYATDLYNSKIQDSAKTDSIVVEKTGQYLSKNAYFLVRYSSDKNIDTIIVSKDNNSVFQVFNEHNMNIPGMKDTWLKIADFNTEESYHVYDVSILPYQYNYHHNNKADTVNSEYDITLNAILSSSETMNINNSKISALQYSIKWDSKLTFNYIFDGDKDSVQVLRTYLTYNRWWFSENIGIVKFQLDYPKKNWGTMPYTSKFSVSNEQMNGKVSELIRFHIN